LIFRVNPAFFVTGGKWRSSLRTGRDVNQLEPAMVSRHEKIIPELKRALSGETRWLKRRKSISDLRCGFGLVPE